MYDLFWGRSPYRYRARKMDEERAKTRTVHAIQVE
jgi:hypothetical protein